MVRPAPEPPPGQRSGVQLHVLVHVVLDVLQLVGNVCHHHLCGPGHSHRDADDRGPAPELHDALPFKVGRAEGRGGRGEVGTFG